MTDVVLATHGLTKSFGALMATDSVSLDLRAGEIHAVIGPNGAGKSTLISQICGGLVPDAGRVELLGHDVTMLPARLRAQQGLARTFQISALAMDRGSSTSRCGCGGLRTIAQISSSPSTSFTVALMFTQNVWPSL